MEDTQELCRSLAGAAEPVWDLRVELGDLSWPEDEVLVAQDESQPPGQNEIPLAAFVCPALEVALLIETTIFHARTPPDESESRGRT
jgi:hypothetical protein